MSIFLEFDFSQTWIETIYKGLRQTGSVIQKRMETEDYFDGLHAFEHFEELFGVACVIAQTYMNRTWAQIIEADRKLNKSEKKWDAIPMFGQKIQDTDITDVALIYHLANYWKHSDEWKDWNPRENEDRFHTINTLSAVGITENTEFPCVRGFEKLGLFVDPLFAGLEEIIFQWRDTTAKYHLAEGGS